VIVNHRIGQQEIDALLQAVLTLGNALMESA
jgi:hypothetical protein